MEVAPEGFSGDAKGTGGRLLSKTHKVDEAEGLGLLREEEDNLVGFPAEGAKTAKGRSFLDSPADPGASPPPPASATASSGFSFTHGSTIIWRDYPPSMKIVPSIRWSYHRRRARKPRPHPHGMPPRPRPRSTGAVPSAGVPGRTHRPRRLPVRGPRPSGPVPSKPGMVYHLYYYTYAHKYINLSLGEVR